MYCLKKAKRKGLSLLEVLIALVLLIVITGAGFFAIFGVANFQGNRFKRRMMALGLCEDTVSYLRNCVADDTSAAVPGSRYQDRHNPTCWALSEGKHDNPTCWALSEGKHVDPIPSNSELHSNVGVPGVRYYTVSNHDLNSDGEYDYKKVEIVVKWYEPEQ